ncbi:hypothetical protein [Desulfococcus sp.]|uniref:hypothetical protein n=1 Tax=Desulfococcus sp. TaxID=2025834 RepID=UPI0035936E27
MDEDIRDKVDIRHDDIVGLNFIRDTGRHMFRKHCRQGLRSRIMEVLDAGDVRKEAEGEWVDGIRVFPRARPTWMLRIFTRRFASPADVLEEARMYSLVEACLGQGHIAASSEFIVDYIRDGRREMLLCGLQAFVEGEILDPWGFVYPGHLAELCRRMPAASDGDADVRVRRARKSAESLLGRLRDMVTTAGYIPDLSGIGNLILTPSGNIRLVDINNITKVAVDDVVPTDDKGYPVCDKSIEVMAILERELAGRPFDRNDPLYRLFLDPARMARVKEIEEKFYRDRQKQM